MKKFLLLFTLLLLVTILAAQPFITVKGKNIVGPDGKPFLMKGTNLGNWLVPEGYMFKFKEASSPRMINEVITELIGPAGARQFWKAHLANYITRNDIHYLHSLGMNSIRIPFHYKLFTDKDYLGGKGEQRGFAIMDSVVQ
jgi:endoglucanase